MSYYCNVLLLSCIHSSSCCGIYYLTCLILHNVNDPLNYLDIMDNIRITTNQYLYYSKEPCFTGE